MTARVQAITWKSVLSKELHAGIYNLVYFYFEPDTRLILDIPDYKILEKNRGGEYSLVS